NGPIHLLLSDVIMPEISGPEFARRLKIILPEMKSLFMSGFPDNALHQNGLLDQGVSFLQKPFSVEGLTKRVREVLDS
ncbi:MAG: domain S-box protein, partial [Deltaproteobacteria bacterium]|nr:domain S-box protein [Deltaproteobacteria bacterium]